MGYGLKRVSERRSDALTQVGWQQLESLLADHYRRQGYDVEHCGTGAGASRFDGGVDLRLRRDGDYVLVQAKHWKARQVPHNAVHELLGITVNEGATGAILVTSGEFTRAAIEAATRQGHVQLVDGEDLRTMLGEWTRAEIVGTSQSSRADEFVRTMSAPLAQREPLQVRAYGPRRDASGPRWIAFAIVALLVFGLLIRGVLKKTEGTAGPSQAITASDTHGDGELEIDPRPSSVASPAEVDACHDVVDRESGTYIDRCRGTHAVRQLSEAELREQKRRADEAIRIIEASTPEM